MGPLKCNCLNKIDCPLKGKCRYECVVYKVVIYCDHNGIKNNNKKVYVGYTQDVKKIIF